MPLLAHVLAALLLLDQAPAQGRPRIGLVLSGGGARGMAHVGVLQVLEELRVPIDCIVGISMGAVVGGFNAYGLFSCRPATPSTTTTSAASCSRLSRRRSRVRFR